MKAHLFLCFSGKTDQQNNVKVKIGWWLFTVARKLVWWFIFCNYFYLYIRLLNISCFLVVKIKDIRSFLPSRLFVVVFRDSTGRWFHRRNLHDFLRRGSSSNVLFSFLDHKNNILMYLHFCIFCMQWRREQWRRAGGRGEQSRRWWRPSRLDWCQKLALWARSRRPNFLRNRKYLNFYVILLILFVHLMDSIMP